VLELVVDESSPVVVVDGSTVVEVVGRVVVVVGRAVDAVVEVDPGPSPAVEVRTRGRARVVVVEDAPAKPPRGRRVVEDATSAGTGLHAASPPGTGAVTNPIRVPPAAPTTTATARIAHRRSMLNRTNAPAYASRSDDKRIGKLHPRFSGGSS
jgi:hypothetical protein